MYNSQDSTTSGGVRDSVLYSRMHNIRDPAPSRGSCSAGAHLHPLAAAQEPQEARQKYAGTGP